jgi:hypothetical protein
MRDPNKDPYLSREEQSRVFDSLSGPWQTFAIESHITDVIEVDSATVDPHEIERQVRLLVEHLGFTPDEAARYVAGDRTAIEAVAARRIAALEVDDADAESPSHPSIPSAD